MAIEKTRKKGKKNRKHGRSKAKCQRYRERRARAIARGAPLKHKERKLQNR